MPSAISLSNSISYPSLLSHVRAFVMGCFGHENNFYFPFFFYFSFSDFIGILFSFSFSFSFLLGNKEARDKEVT